MSYSSQTLLYAGSLFLAALLPGPGMLAIMLQTLKHGKNSGFGMLCGLITGDIIFLCIAIFVVNPIIHQILGMSYYLFITCSCYLFYFSYRLWFFKGDLLYLNPEISKKNIFSTYGNGLFITLNNPKTISFYIAFIPTILSSPTIGIESEYIIFTTIFILTIVGLIYIFFSLFIKRYLIPLKNQKVFLKSLAIVICLLALTMLYNTI